MSYNPAAGTIQHVALFSMSHTTGTFSTGALGFTPKAAFYIGGVQDSSGAGSMANGMAIGTAGNARANGFGFNEGPGAPQLPGGTVGIDSSAIGGRSQAIQNTFQFTSFAAALDVSAFGAGGIDLTWSIAVNAHSGNLLVLG